MNDPIAWKSLFAQVRSVTLGLGHKVMVFNSDGKTSEKKDSFNLWILCPVNSQSSLSVKVKVHSRKLWQLVLKAT